MTLPEKPHSNPVGEFVSTIENRLNRLDNVSGLAHIRSLLSKLGGSPIYSPQFPSDTHMVGKFAIHKDPGIPWIYFWHVDPKKQLKSIQYGPTYRYNDILKLKQQLSYGPFWNELKDVFPNDMFPEDEFRETIYFLPKSVLDPPESNRLPFNKNIILEMRQPGIYHTNFVDMFGGFDWFDLASGSVYAFTQVSPALRQVYKGWKSSNSKTIVITDLISVG